MNLSQNTAGRIPIYLFLLLTCTLLALIVSGCQDVESPLSVTSTTEEWQLLTAIAMASTPRGTTTPARIDVETAQETPPFVEYSSPTPPAEETAVLYEYSSPTPLAEETAVLYEYSSPTPPPEKKKEQAGTPLPAAASTAVPEKKTTPIQTIVSEITLTVPSEPADKQQALSPQEQDASTALLQEDTPASEAGSFSMASSSEKPPEDILSEIGNWSAYWLPWYPPGSLTPPEANNYSVEVSNSQLHLQGFAPFERVRVFLYEIYVDNSTENPDYHARLVNWDNYQVDETGGLAINLDMPPHEYHQFVVIGEEAGEIFQDTGYRWRSIIAPALDDSDTTPNPADSQPAEPEPGEESAAPDPDQSQIDPDTSGDSPDTSSDETPAEPDPGEESAAPDPDQSQIDPDTSGDSPDTSSEDTPAEPDPDDSIPAPAPEIRDFQYCLEPCTGSNRASEIPGGTQRVYLYWTYHNIPIGSTLTRIWRTHLGEWVRYECIWQGPESGVVEISLREPGGLYSAPWEFIIDVDGQTLLYETVNITGNWQYWDPAGRLNSCF